MIAVIFEVRPKPDHKQEYLDLAAELKPILETIDGFISVERFESLTEKGKILSLSFFRDEEAGAAWRNVPQHRKTQAKGRASVFDNYRLRIAGVIRDYGMDDRAQAPKDSRAAHVVKKRSSTRKRGEIMPATPAEKRIAFRKLHEAGCFVLPNPFDVGGALAL